jgi:hypothetical protein
MKTTPTLSVLAAAILCTLAFTTTIAQSADPLPSSNSNHAAQDKPAASPAGGDDTAELAKKLANPVASLISVPLQSNFDLRMGTGSGWRYTLNVQPVIPVKLSPNWNMISRTILPLIHQSNVTAPGGSGFGAITSYISRPSQL